MILQFENIVLKSATLEDLSQLHIVYEEAREYFSFDPDHDSITPQACIEDGDLPPNGTRDRFEILSCFVNGEIKGYLTFYQGYPDEKTVYISFMYLLQNKRKQGVGSRVIQHLTEIFKELGFEQMKLVVSLRNWEGLKFWQKCGFDKITLVKTDGAYSKEKYGCLELVKSLIS